MPVGGMDFRVNSILRGVAEITFFVDNIDLARIWYRQIFGDPVFDDEYFCLFQGPGIQVGLHPSDAKTPSGSGGQVLYWKVENLVAVLKALEQRQCQRYRGPIVGVDGSMVCQIVDPFGNLWGLRQDSSD